jgi:acyl carrier protein
MSVQQHGTNVRLIPRIFPYIPFSDQSKRQLPAHDRTIFPPPTTSPHQHYLYLHDYSVSRRVIVTRNSAQPIYSEEHNRQYPFIDLCESANPQITRRIMDKTPDDQITTQQTHESQFTSTECDLALLWSSLLDIPEVGVDENFFALGGNSFIATRLIARIRVVFGVSVTLRTVFDFPTIAQLAQAIDRQEKLSRPLTIKRSKRRPQKTDDD